MSGTQNVGEESDNPVGINATAMVDVIFCLCLFFMCSLHFKELEGKIDTWLPKDRGNNPTPVDKVELDETRIYLDWDDKTAATVRGIGVKNVGIQKVSSDEDLMKWVVRAEKDWKDAGKKDFRVLIDPAKEVPWMDVIHVMDLCKQEGIERIEFTAPFMEPQGPGGEPPK